MTRIRKSARPASFLVRCIFGGDGPPWVRETLPLRLLLLRLAFEFDQDHFEWLVADVFRLVRSRRSPLCFAGLGAGLFAFAIGISEFRALIVEEDRHAVRMLVHRGFVARRVVNAQHADLV